MNPVAMVTDAMIRAFAIVLSRAKLTADVAFSLCQPCVAFIVANEFRSSLASSGVIMLSGFRFSPFLWETGPSVWFAEVELGSGWAEFGPSRPSLPVPAVSLSIVSDSSWARTAEYVTGVNSTLALSR